MGFRRFILTCITLVAFITGTYAIIKTRQTVTEGYPVRMYFNLCDHEWPVSLTHKSPNISLVLCSSENSCSHNDASENCVFDQNSSNTTVIVFLLLKVTKADEGPWHLSSTARTTVHIDVKDRPSTCGPTCSHIVKCSRKATEFKVMEGEAIRMFCPRSRESEARVKYPQHEHNGISFGECAPNKPCRYNPTGVFQDPYPNNSTDIRFIIFDVGMRHSGNWSFLIGKNEFFIELDVSDACDGNSTSIQTTSDINNQLPSRTISPVSHNNTTRNDVMTQATVVNTQTTIANSASYVLASANNSAMDIVVGGIVLVYMIT